MSEYERGLKTPNLAVAERIIETAGYRLDLVTEVRFEQHVATGLRPFWVPDHLWRGKLPGCFATVVVDDAMMYGRVLTFDLRQRLSRCRFYELLLGHGKPEAMMERLEVHCSSTCGMTSRSLRRSGGRGSRSFRWLRMDLPSSFRL